VSDDQQGAVRIAALLAALRAEAEAELADLDVRTRQQAQAITEQAHVDAERLEREPVLVQEPELQAEVQRRLASARLDAARTLREARETCFGEALGALRKHLAALRAEDRYPAVFAALLREALAALPTATRLRVDPRDERLAAAVAPALAIEPVLETWGGAVVCSDDGRLAHNTIEERLANAEQTLRMQAAARSHGP
jgi:V/A-type H+-transporting ATPase subunit E